MPFIRQEKLIDSNYYRTQLFTIEIDLTVYFSWIRINAILSIILESVYIWPHKYFLLQFISGKFPIFFNNFIIERLLLFVLLKYSPLIKKQINLKTCKINGNNKIFIIINVYNSTKKNVINSSVSSSILSTDINRIHLIKIAT